jgi:hypothetical protein
MKLNYGIKNQIVFSNEDEFYFTLGFLAKTNKTTEFIFEKNSLQGARTDEYRIHCLKDLAKFPVALSNAFTDGRSGVLHRINCNEFIYLLIKTFGFATIKIQDVTLIRSKIPEEHLENFDNGLNS